MKEIASKLSSREKNQCTNNFGDFLKKYEKHVVDDFRVLDNHGGKPFIKDNRFQTTSFDEKIETYHQQLIPSGKRIPCFVSQFTYQSGVPSRMYHFVLDISNAIWKAHAAKSREKKK